VTTILITGANRGIGLELARQCVERGDDVVAACRRSSPELDALDLRVVEGVDVATSEGVAKLAREVDGLHLDVLLNNSGILERGGLEDLDEDSLRRQFEVNSLGPLRVTRALLGNLGRGSKVGILTSLMGSMADNGSGSYYGYRMSKAAVNAAGVSLARDLASREIAVVLLHPGMVATEMTGRRGIAVEESVRGLLARLDELDLEASGSFRHADGRHLDW